MEVFIRGIESGTNLPYGFRNGVGSIRINPLLMFQTTVANSHISPNTQFPYYPLYYNAALGEIETLEDNNEPYGILLDNLDYVSAQSDISVSGTSFWQAQTPSPVGIVEWPVNAVGQQGYTGNTIHAATGNNPTSLLAYLNMIYPVGTIYQPETVCELPVNLVPNIIQQIEC